MSGKLLGLRKRLARVEQTLAKIAKRQELASCICREVTVALPTQPEEFEAEMNRTCPVHGFRRLGRIMRIGYVDPDGTDIESPELDRLLQIYETHQPPRKLGLSRLAPDWALKLKHDSQEP